MVRAMRIFPVLLGAIAAVAVSAHAAKPPPLGDDAPSDRPGKPPPLGQPLPGTPRGTAPPRPMQGGPMQGGPMRPGDRPYASGSGFMVADGRGLTNNHVVGECRRVVARNGSGTQAPARLLATDPERDLALLGLPAGFAPPLTFRDSPDVERGESVVTYGFPLTGLLSSGPSLTTGSITALTGLRDSPIDFVISAPVQPGNSGGPLLDAHGHVVGVIVAKLNAARVATMLGGDIPQNVNFAIKGTQASAFLREHNVEPALAGSFGPEMSAADVGRLADPSTLFLQCFR
jgi:S1-C subfamily serine protease